MNRRVKRNGIESLRQQGSLPVIGGWCVYGEQGCASLVVFQSIGENLPVRRALQFSFENYSPLVFIELGWGCFCGKADLPSEALTRRRPWQASRNRNYLPIQSRFRFAARMVLHFLCLAQDLRSASLGKAYPSLERIDFSCIPFVV
jgi:hypothetical protein